MCQQQQAKQENDEYWQAVTNVAENVVADIEDADEDRERCDVGVIIRAVYSQMRLWHLQGWQYSWLYRL